MRLESIILYMSAKNYIIFLSIILETLGKEKGMLGVIFRKSLSKIQDPAKLRRLIELINQETWVGMDIDVKGEIYEGL